MSSAILKRSAQSLSRSVRLPNSPYCFALKESDHIEPSRLCAGPQLQLPVFPLLLFRRSPIATGLLYDLHICGCLECVLLIKMTCAVNWIIVRERRADSTSLSHPDLAGSRGKTVSGHLALSPDAEDDHDFFCALSCSYIKMTPVQERDKAVLNGTSCLFLKVICSSLIA